MKWLDKWIAKKCREAWNNSRSIDTLTLDHPAPIPCKADKSFMDSRKSISFQMQPANGGTIIEVSHYDRSRDEWERELYIINENDNFVETLSGVITQYKLTHG